MHFMSFADIVAIPEMGQSAPISIPETLWLPIFITGNRLVNITVNTAR
jgi:hypothetical protein